MQSANGAGQSQLRNIVRVKGQEENVLRGIGLVVGLNGTGEAGDSQTMRALARAMEVMGNPVSMTGRLDDAALNELKKIKNVSLGIVTATIPATGARRGDKLDCYVSGINGKSLAGGRLAFAALEGPNLQDGRVFALCQGQLVVDDIDQPMVARVQRGCQMEQDVFTPFIKDGLVTLVIDHNHADFQVATDIARQINYNFSDQAESGDVSPAQSLSNKDLARAIDAANVVVRVPDSYSDYPVAFVADVLDMSVDVVEPEARVTINPRAGSIIIGGDVAVGDVVVTHRNLVIETGPTAELARVDAGDFNRVKLDRLIQALGELKVPADDMIEIIRGIDRNGKLHAKLIIE